MEVSERRRLNEESSEQVRPLLDAHKTANAGRENRTEVERERHVSNGGNNAAKTQRCQELTKRFGFGAFAARYQPKNSTAWTLVGAIGLGWAR